MAASNIRVRNSALTARKTLSNQRPRRKPRAGVFYQVTIHSASVGPTATLRHFVIAGDAFALPAILEGTDVGPTLSRGPLTPSGPGTAASCRALTRFSVPLHREPLTLLVGSFRLPPTSETAKGQAVLPNSNMLYVVCRYADNYFM